MHGATIERWPAQHMDGRSAQVHEVELSLDVATLRITEAATGHSVDAWPLRDLRIETLDGPVYHLTHADRPGEMLSTSAVGVAHELGLRRVGPRVSLRDSRLRAAMVYAVAVVAAGSAIWFSLPAISLAIAHRVPLSTEAELGQGIRSFLAPHRCTDPRADEALRAMTRRLIGSSAYPGAIEQVGVVNLEMVNAFALPGGQVVITRGLLDEAKSADEVAGVLAHELQHVQQRHVMAQLVKSSILGFVWAASVGDFSGLMVVDPNTTRTLIERGYSREAERDADEGAHRMLTQANISSQGLANFFLRLRDKSDFGPEWISTHPHSQARFERLQNDPPGAKFTPALDDAQWKALRGACAEHKKGLTLREALGL